MNLYFIHQDEVKGWDTYDSAVVAAETEKAARETHPASKYNPRPNWDSGDWPPTPDLVQVELIGTATDGTPAGVICASFNAG